MGGGGGTGGHGPPIFSKIDFQIRPNWMRKSWEGDF